ncbi:PrsW family intramembrane metalloprotease [Parenemella sanctibonifatiensis]|uniref:PrsW family intramembrane metalloprotease n=1 Tax=Parenemella sanctibonifatiensis TaxID=2016505 RepID=A0A255E8C4_9ACTN|nr:PrsW family intramembrane metalloprotease [Parenemella sanctibonifatiensis]OYN87827.1 hypothetical protein CGZ92_06050 [Parenemella sanctibonifatiensis]
MLQVGDNRRARWRNGIPAMPDLSVPWWKRTLTNPWLWITLAVVAGCTALWFYFIDRLAGTREVVLGPEKIVDVTVTRDMIWDLALPGALPTWLVLVGIFFLIASFGRARLSALIISAAWGASVSTELALHINNWFYSRLTNLGGYGDMASAVFSAPFGEELTKATVVFVLLIFLRYRLVTAMDIVPLAGLSAVGFAFTENLLYFTDMIASIVGYQEAGAGVDLNTYLDELIFLRGFATAFAHPLFTAMTAIGVVVALRARSKLVRVLAPVAGYLFAVLLHALWNGMAGSESAELMYKIVALPLLVATIGLLVIAYIRHVGRVRERLVDYGRMGWLKPTDPKMFSSPWKIFSARWRAAWLLFRPNFTTSVRRLAGTWRMQYLMFELAYLRDSMVRGIVDQAGLTREKALLFEIRSLREIAIDEPGGPVDYPGRAWLRRWRERRRGGPAAAPELEEPAGAQPIRPRPQPARQL